MPSISTIYTSTLFSSFSPSVCLSFFLLSFFFCLWHAPSITDIMIQVFIASPKAYLIPFYPFHIPFLFSLSLSLSLSCFFCVCIFLSKCPSRQKTTFDSISELYLKASKGKTIFQSIFCNNQLSLGDQRKPHIKIVEKNYIYKIQKATFSKNI